ncbi:MAG: hypothetical protein COA79_08245 [Planctomycetota bacterium]|nr:MAG: hypothetical protein COA79_08245 [Planctomycetota bacterium]
MTNILIIDDDKYITDMLEDYLSNYFEVKTFNCPIEALIHYSKTPNYPIVFSDFHMGKINGDELVEQMLKVNPKQKFILCTASMNKKLFEISETYIDQIYLYDKPFDLKKFKELCDTIIESI